MSLIEELGKKAKAASAYLASLTEERKNRALLAMADSIEASRSAILEENQKDILSAKQHGINDIMTDRLALTDSRISAMIQGIRDVAGLPDPIGEMFDETVRPNGLRISKRRVPMGVIGIIFESRPNVASDAAALCFKTSNAVILRGGKEALNSNIAIVNAMRKGLASCGVPEDAVSIVSETGHELVNEMLHLRKYIDLIIPRGGAGLIKAVTENSSIPVIETGTGNCHIYVERSADPDMAVNILFNAKTSRPSVCNAAESLLVDEAIAADFLPAAYKKLSEKNVRFMGCEKTCAILPEAEPASPEDFGREYLDYVISVKVVSGVDEAIKHIAEYSTGHSEAIITKDSLAAEKFLSSVDSAAVYVNASTRFTDGFEFGLGAEIGISTQKMHARGPMGLAALTSYKYVIQGDGQIR